MEVVLRDAEETLRIKAMPERLMNAELPSWSPMSPGLQPLDPMVKEELQLRVGAAGIPKKSTSS